MSNVKRPAEPRTYGHSADRRMWRDHYRAAVCTLWLISEPINLQLDWRNKRLLFFKKLKSRRLRTCVCVWREEMMRQLERKSFSWNHFTDISGRRDGNRAGQVARSYPQAPGGVREKRREWENVSVWKRLLHINPSGNRFSSESHEYAGRFGIIRSSRKRKINQNVWIMRCRPHLS